MGQQLLVSFRNHRIRYFQNSRDPSGERTSNRLRR